MCSMISSCNLVVFLRVEFAAALRCEEACVPFFVFFPEEDACSVRAFLRCCAVASWTDPHSSSAVMRKMYDNDWYTVGGMISD